MAAGFVKAAQFGLFSYLAIVLPVEVYGHFGIYYAFLAAMGTFAAAGICERTAGQLKTRPPGPERMALFRNNAGLFVVTGLAALAVISPLGIYTISQTKELSEQTLLFALYRKCRKVYIFADSIIVGSFSCVVDECCLGGQIL